MVYIFGIVDYYALHSNQQLIAEPFEPFVYAVRIHSFFFFGRLLNRQTGNRTLRNGKSKMETCKRRHNRHKSHSFS